MLDSLLEGEVHKTHNSSVTERLSFLNVCFPHSAPNTLKIKGICCMQEQKYIVAFDEFIHRAVEDTSEDVTNW